MSDPNDTTTELNPGVGGDLMDESLITQSDGITQAKRPRVVIAGDADGRAVVDPTSVDPGASPMSLPALIIGVINDAPSANLVDGQLRAASLTTEGRLRVSSAPAQVYPDYFGDSRPSFVGPVAYSNLGNPWSMT